MSKSPRQVAEEYWRAEASRDVESVLAMYRPDAEFYPISGVLKGHAEIRTFYDGMGDTFPGLEVEIVHEISRGDEAALEWEAVLIARDGTRFPIRGVNIIEVSDGLISRMRSYFDPTQFPTPAVSK
jgi:ketosteroid isomerase-like protein